MEKTMEYIKCMDFMHRLNSFEKDTLLTELIGSKIWGTPSELFALMQGNDMDGFLKLCKHMDAEGKKIKAAL